MTLRGCDAVYLQHGGGN